MKRMKTYIIEIGNFKGENGYKFSTKKTKRLDILSEFINQVVILGTSKFLKNVFLGENARINTDQPVNIVEMR
jgi:hypothetical protein